MASRSRMRPATGGQTKPLGTSWLGRRCERRSSGSSRGLSEGTGSVLGPERNSTAAAGFGWLVFLGTMLLMGPRSWLGIGLALGLMLVVLTRGRLAAHDKRRAYDKTF